MCAVTGNEQASSPSSTGHGADIEAQAAPSAEANADSSNRDEPGLSAGDEHQTASQNMHNVNAGSEAGHEQQVPQPGPVEDRADADAQAQAHAHHAVQAATAAAQSSEVAFLAEALHKATYCRITWSERVVEHWHQC